MTLVIKENETITIENIGARQIAIKDYSSVVHIFHTAETEHELTVDLGLGASYTSVFLQKNNNFTLNINLNAPQARTDIASIFLATANQECRLSVNHNAANTYSNQLFKGIAWGKGSSDITLKTSVCEDIHAIEAYQLLRGIVLEDSALIKSCPLLDIRSDDVACAHGAAIGTIDKAQTFYMQSRGMTEEEARKILITAFIQEIIDKVPQTGIQNEFIKYLEDI